MKLPAFQLLVIPFMVSISGYSQKITIDRNNASLEEVLINIHQQTGYSYSASEQILQNAKRFDIHVKDTSVEHVLNLALKNQSLTYAISDKIIIIKVKRKIDINGRIVNDKGDPTIVTVSEKGRPNAVSTNTEGYFLLKHVHPDAVLLITGIAITPLEIKVNGKTKLSEIAVQSKPISLKEVSALAISDYEPRRSNDAFSFIDKTQLIEQTGIIQRLNNLVYGSFTLAKTDTARKIIQQPSQ